MKIAPLAATLTSLALSLGTLTALPAPTAAAADACNMNPVALGTGARVSVPFTLDQTGAPQMLAGIKSARASALSQNLTWEGVPLRTWLTSNSISEATYLNPTWSRDLELIAIQRSAESEFYWDYSRPNGEEMVGSVTSSGLAADQEITIDPEALASVASMSTTTTLAATKAMAATTQRASTRRASATSTRAAGAAGAAGTKAGIADLTPEEQAQILAESMIDPHLASYGIAATMDGLLVLEGSVSQPAAQTPTGWTGTCRLSIPFLSGDLKVTGSPLTATVGSPVTLRTTAQWIPGLPDYTDAFPVSGSYTSSNPAVATVSGSTLTPVAPGTTTLTVLSGDQSLTYGTVTVNRPMSLGTVTIANTPRLGYGLVAKLSSITPSDAVLTYQWSANGVAIPGATRVSFTPTTAQVGKRISVRITATKPGYVTTVKGSSQTAPVAPGTLTTALPTIANTPRVGYGLIAKPGNWGPAPVTFTYQWSANGVAIPGATRVSYTPTAAMKGKRISVRVTGSKPGYTSVVKGSTQTAPVA